MPWIFGRAAAVPAKIDGRRWELYDLDHDFSESTDLAAKYPATLDAMKQLFFEETGRNHGLPVHRYDGVGGRPDYNAGQKEFTFYGPAERIPEDVAPPLTGRSFDLVADVTMTADDRVVASGTVLATVDFRFSLDETFDIGSDTGTPVAVDDYATPNAFGGLIQKLVVQIR
jgi:hypothetical protein